VDAEKASSRKAAKESIARLVEAIDGSGNPALHERVLHMRLVEIGQA
jgi:hypothetical protein